MASAPGEDLTKLYLNSEIDCNELVNQLELQLQDLDATEFELPQLSELPTLESILNEPDDEDDNLDSGSEYAEDHGHPSPPGSAEQKASFSSEAETVSVHSRTSSRGSTELLSGGGGSGSGTARSRREGRQAAAAVSVVRHVALTGIASQLVSAHERVGAGLPTTMAVGSVISVGTSHGLVMVFEPSQALKWCFEPHQTVVAGGEQHGSVSALALSEDGTRLLAGYAKGHLCLFDLITGNLMQSIADAHTACTAVLHLKWTDLPNIAMLSDSGGSVFELTVKRTMGLNSNMSRCIFTGSRGEVCTVEPLLMSRFHVAPLLHNVIVAMATITKVIVVSLRPSPKVLFSHPLRAASSSLPLLAWQFVVIQMPDRTRVVDPVLAFGRQNSLYFYQVTHGIGDSLQFLPLRKITTDCLLHNVAWLNPSTIALLDSSEQCHVMDVRSQKVIESIDLTNLGLVYASHHFKAMATGGNVSKAMAVAGERACYHSMVSFGNQVILLGTKALQVLTVRSWHERLDQLFEGRQIVACLQLARQMASGRAAAVVGLPHRRSKRRAELQEKITALTLSLMEDWHMAPVSQASQVVSELASLCLECGLQDLLLGRVWEVLQDHPGHKGVFLESLEPFILSGALPALPPSISQQLLQHYEQQQRLEPLESCLVRLSVASLDLHQTMTLCWAHGLYDAIIYVYTRGMRDYVTPLQELTTVLTNALDTLQCEEALPPSLVSLGNKLLVFVSGCLAGRGYPHGDIDSDQLQQVKYEVFKCLSSVHSKNAEDSQKPFPYIRTLLRFDTREFLNVLSLAFEEPEFTTELGLLQRQRLIDILMQVMAESPDVFGSLEVCSLYTFIARQLARQTNTTPRNTKLVDKVVLELCREGVTSQREERQTALLELLQDDALQHVPSDTLLRHAEQAQFWRVCESVHVSEGRLERVLSCYINDPSRLHQVLPYLQQAALHQTQQQLNTQLLHHFQALVELDAPGVACLLLDTSSLVSLSPSLLHSLDQVPLVQYQALRACHQHKAVSRRSGALTEELQKRLLALMCQLEPDAVLDHLRTSSGDYFGDTALQIVRGFPSLRECEALLLLQVGQLQEALEIYVALLAETVVQLKKWEAEDETDDTPSDLLAQFESKVSLVSSIIESHCRTVTDERRRQALWFPLLDQLLASPPARSPTAAASIGESCGSVVSTMLGQVSPPAILERVLREPSACQPDHVLRLMQSLVSRYRYERRVYCAMSGAVRTEQLLCVSARRAHHRAPVAVSANTCSICGQRYSRDPSGGETLQVFRCGHSYHQSCGVTAHDVTNDTNLAEPETSSNNSVSDSSSSKARRYGCAVCKNSPSQLSSLTTAAALRLRGKGKENRSGESPSHSGGQRTTENTKDVSPDATKATSDAEKNTSTTPAATPQLELTAGQRDALTRVYQLGLTGCRVAMLEKLAQRQDSYSTDAYSASVEGGTAGHDRWLSEKFPLRLAPPPATREYVDL